MSTLVQALTWLAAPQCVWCHQATQWNKQVCDACETQFYTLALAHTQGRVPEGLDDLWCALPYAGDVRTWIARVKTGRSVLAAQTLAHRMAGWYRPHADDTAGLRWIVPVALPARRWVSRGFNQAHYLAQGLAEHHGGQIQTILRTSPWRTSLSSQNKRARLASDHAFTVHASASREIPGTIWLVDDVVTNGTTLKRAADVLRARWPHVRLYGITLARTPPL